MVEKKLASVQQAIHHFSCNKNKLVLTDQMLLQSLFLSESALLYSVYYNDKYNILKGKKRRGIAGK